ncbi:hypothetical protein [Nocardiopsis algeriensis]|uniref:Excreted virulence factor EspC (Type VII ESX diderm) n=1 Tax=Nocardiopsis algeriensis TaxID=1478215 RepID=A0A841IV38_9ACTN|nr:hypothetical protein [Nocardiopsis algeriensis]MBB6122194.1 hypothetical protein [Nocardiopsis algeriensis]
MSENTPDSAGPSQAAASGGTATATQQAVQVVVDLPSFEGDVAAMRAHTTFVDTVVLPHYEGLLNAARRAGMGEEMLARLAQGQEAVAMARTQVAHATDAVVRLNAAVAQAHADAAAAATKKSYYTAD